MKSVLRGTALQAFSLYALSTLVSGVTIRGGVETYLFAGFILSIMSITIKPLLTIITLPFSLLTMGFFSFVVQGFILYLLTVFLQSVSVSAFTFPGGSFAGFVVPRTHLNIFFTYLASAFLFSLVYSLLKWLFED